MRDVTPVVTWLAEAITVKTAVKSGPGTGQSSQIAAETSRSYRCRSDRDTARTNTARAVPAFGYNRSQHFHIAFKDHFAVNFELRHYAVNGFVQLGRVSGVIPVKIGLLIMGCQQLRFSIDAAPVIRERPD